MAYYKCASIYGTANSAASIQTASGAIANFNTKLAMPLKSLEIDVNATQEAGTPTPQSPKAISGVSEVNLVKCGKNLFNLNYLSVSGITIENGVVSGTAQTFHENFNRNVGGVKGLKFKTNTSYTISFKAYTDGNITTTGQGIYIGFRYIDGTNSNITLNNDVTSLTSYTVASTSSKVISCIQISYVSGNYNIWHLSDIQLEETTEATSFEPYTGNTYNILFPPYSENLPYFEGLLAGTHGFVDLGSLTWNYNAGDYVGFYANIPDKRHDIANANMICTKYSTYPYNGTNIGVLGSMPDKSITGFNNASSSNSWVYAKDSAYSDSYAFKNAMQGVYLIYELAESVTPTITPEQYQTLLRAFAGVYYGGYVKQDKDGHRKFEVTWYKQIYNGNQTLALSNWRPTETSVGFAFTEGDYLGTRPQTNNIKANIISNKLETVTYNNAFNGGSDNSVSVSREQGYGVFIRIGDTSLVNSTLVNQYLAQNPIEVIYELAEPFTIDLPDGIPIKSLPGVNNIYADTGDTKVAFKKLI